MKVFFVNISPNSSTGDIMGNIANKVLKENGEIIIATPPKKQYVVNDNYHIQIGSKIGRKINILFGRICSNELATSYFATIKLIKSIEQFQPDLINLHNIHSYYVNIPLLFGYIRRKKIPVVWTFHDAWPITGQCPHFLANNCKQWHNGCSNCRYYREYPFPFFDRTEYKYKLKKQLFTSINNLIVVTPSEWLKHTVEESFLKNNRIICIHNGIDLGIFTCTGFINERLVNYKSKKIILGVATEWTEKKGIDTFLSLASEISDEYVIALVGKIPNETSHSKIIYLGSVYDKSELASIYASCDVLLNPTKEDTFPTVNIEALACGIPVVTFNVGGSAEIIDKTSGTAINIPNNNNIIEAINMVCNSDKFNKLSCRRRASEFDKKKQAQQYFDLFSEICTK